MSAKTHFPFFRWIAKTLTGRWARRVYVIILSVLLIATTAARLRSYLMARKIQAVLHGLSEIRIDQTTEEQLFRTVPYLRRGEDWYRGNPPRGEDWEGGGNTPRHWCYTEISNESDWLMSRLLWRDTGLRQVAVWLGYRYMDFGASMLVENGKVSEVGYGLSKVPGRPKGATYIVTAESIHGLWKRQPVRITSEEDESPQYRIKQTEFSTMFFGRENYLRATYTNDAPPDLIKNAFRLNLSCFWSLQECGDAREIAPGLWQDAKSIQKAAYDRLTRGKCPDAIVEGRVRYLPDMSVSLLEVTGSGRVEVNEEGSSFGDQFTDYRLKEVIRGRDPGPQKGVHWRQVIPSPVDPMQTIGNQFSPPTKIGTQVLFFGTQFDSCRFIPATPSALEIVRKTPVAPKKREDEIQTGLL